jgi:hypothetical protein
MDEILSDYEKTRNELIPEAEEFANKTVGVRFQGGSEKEREEWTSRWNRCFHDKMKELAKEKGLE